MNTNKMILSFLIVFLTLVSIGGQCNAGTINKRLVADFAAGEKYAKLYHGSVLSESGDPIDIKITVYEQPIVIDYFYSFLDEVDFSIPEAILLSRLSESTLEWYETNRDIVKPEEDRAMFAEGLLRYAITNHEAVTHYIVGKMEFVDNGIEYVSYKFYRIFHEYDIEFHLVFTAEKTSSRWKLKHSESDLETLFATIKSPIFADMLTMKFSNDISEINQIYRESHVTGTLDPSILVKWFWSLLRDPDMTSKASDFVSIYYSEEFDTDVDMSVNSDRKSFLDWTEQFVINQEAFAQALQPKFEAAKEKMAISE